MGSEMCIRDRDKKWNKVLLEADKIVIAMGGVPRRTLFDALKDKVPEIYAIGDCVKPRKIYDAIHEGFHVGREI